MVYGIIPVWSSKLLAPSKGFSVRQTKGRSRKVLAAPQELVKTSRVLGFRAYKGLGVELDGIGYKLVITWVLSYLRFV